jgi:hypothetical protein
MTISTGTATINGDVTGTGTSSLIIFSGAGLLRLGDSFYTSANGTLTTVAGSTVEYNGTDQIIESHTTYRNLTLSGSGNKTLSASTNTTIGGNLVVGDNTSFNDWSLNACCNRYNNSWWRCKWIIVELHQLPAPKPLVVL